MEDDLDKMLATKKEWRTRQGGDRRIKDGTPEDRKITADVLRRGRQLKVDSLKPCFFIRLLRLIFPIIIMAILQAPAQAYTEKQAIKAIIGEAENQGKEGMLAVACAIRNRGTLKGVYGLNAPRVRNHLYTARIYAQAAQAWADSAQTDITHGATAWENILAFGKPYWYDQFEVTVKIGSQEFMKRRST